jgi:F-type H+-transporting ATPase subunit b
MKKLFATFALAGALMVAPVSVHPAFAQEKSEAAESQSSDEKPGLEIWKWVNFAILAGILGWMISKNMGPVLAQRSAEIQEGLKAGERAKAEADARAAAVQGKLAGLETAIAQMKVQAKEERERETARIRRDTELELTRIKQQAEMEIASAEKTARLSIRRDAAKYAIELAERKVRDRMSPEMQGSLLNNFVGALGKRSSGAEA